MTAKQQMREILDYLANSSYPYHEYGDTHKDENEKLIDQALSDIDTIVKEVIGDKEPEVATKVKLYPTRIRNELRQEQLKRWG